MRIAELFKGRHTSDVKKTSNEARGEAGKKHEAEKGRGEEILSELLKLKEENKLAGSVEEYVQDPQFAGLLREFDTAASVRIYDAERRADKAARIERERIYSELARQKALPRPIKADAPTEPVTDFSLLSTAEFERLKKRVRAGR